MYVGLFSLVLISFYKTHLVIEKYSKLQKLVLQRLFCALLSSSDVIKPSVFEYQKICRKFLTSSQPVCIVVQASCNRSSRQYSSPPIPGERQQMKETAYFNIRPGVEGQKINQKIKSLISGQQSQDAKEKLLGKAIYWEINKWFFLTFPACF